jgi:hypothetical protein
MTRLIVPELSCRLISLLGKHRLYNCMVVHTHYRLLGWSTVHSRSNSEFSATERVHRWCYPRDDPTISYYLFLPFCYVHHVKFSLYWTAVPWWSTVLEKRITSHLSKNFLHFMKPYGLYFPKHPAAVSCAESGGSSPHVPTQCYSPGYTWPSKRSPSVRLTHPNPVFISLLCYECHMAKPYHPWLNYHNIICKVIKWWNSSHEASLNLLLPPAI